MGTALGSSSHCSIVIQLWATAVSCTRESQPSLICCTKRWVVGWSKIIYHQRTWWSPVPIPPLGTGSFLQQSSVSPALKWLLELSRWRRSAPWCTHGRKLHKARRAGSAAAKGTLKEQGKAQQPQSQLQDRPLLHSAQQGHETEHKPHHFPTSYLFPLGNDRDKQMHLHRFISGKPIQEFLPWGLNVYKFPCCAPSATTATLAVIIFCPYLLGPDKLAFFQCVSYLLQKLFRSSTFTWNSMLLEKLPAL